MNILGLNLYLNNLSEILLGIYKDVAQMHPTKKHQRQKMVTSPFTSQNKLFLEMFDAI